MFSQISGGGSVI